MGWVTGLTAALQVLPSLIDAVMQISEKFERDDDSGSQNGALKKQVLLNVIENSMRQAEKFDEGGVVTTGNQRAILGLADATTDAVVALRNGTGRFQTSGQSGQVYKGADGSELRLPTTL